MQIFVNRINRVIQRSLTDTRQVTQLNFKRGDGAEIEIIFLDGETQVELAADTVVTFGAKERFKFDGPPIVLSSEFILVDGGGETPRYVAHPSFNTVALNTLLMVDGDGSNDVVAVDLGGEITWKAPLDTEPTTTEDFIVRVTNDYLRGDEDTPAAFPNPAEWMPAALTIATGDPNAGDAGTTHGQSLQVLDTGIWYKWDSVEALWVLGTTGSGTVDNATVIAAIATDPAATRASLNLGSLTTAESSGLSIKDTDGATWRIHINTSGALTTQLLMGALAAEYYDATEIAEASAEQLSLFFEALSGAGLLANLWDGQITKSAYSVIGAGSMRTLRNKAPMRLSGAPVLGAAGLAFSGTQSAQMDFPNAVESSRTFFALQHFDTNGQSPYNTDAVAWGVIGNGTGGSLSGIKGERLQFGGTSTASDIVTLHSTGPTAATLSAVGPSRSFPPRPSFTAATYEYGGARAITGRIQGGPIVSGTSATPSWGAQALRIGGRNDTWTAGDFPNAQYCPHSLGAWLLFDKLLTSLEIADVYAAVSIVCPRFRWLIEGDSIANFTTPVMLNLSRIYGANIDVISGAVGGQTSADGVAQLGSAPLSIANLDGSLPTVAGVTFGANDLSLTVDTPATIHARLRTLWDYVKTNNPDAALYATTVLPAAAIHTALRDADRLALNVLIRADLGVRYDALVDQDQLYLDNYNPEHAGTVDTALLGDGVHPSSTFAAILGEATLDAIESLGIQTI